MTRSMCFYSHGVLWVNKHYIYSIVGHYISMIKYVNPVRITVLTFRIYQKYPLPVNMAVHIRANLNFMTNLSIYLIEIPKIFLKKKYVDIEEH